ncbi:SAM-dependent methyltransferase [Solihabitans fulvus]|uniref:S-adenosyl-L-methionine-dependent methyltransferase n=1 Tax=Solihabitans fulvus TaxID=1892852 RepID=A0A5B2WJT8_9PSEU|nr:SAM-dependent methyltransferase [Solihabitans fulvus]KAA2250952.1 SAM-dependent methyltransferase [Solihabitans fulvus]
MPPPTVTRLRAGQPSATAEINAQMRAADATLHPARRLVDDPFAQHFVSNPRYKLLRLTPRVALFGLRTFDRLFGGLLAEILLRGRYFEEQLASAVDRGARQVVLVGAGYDSTALRHPELGDVHFYEVDHPATQAVKRSVLSRIGAKVDNITFIPVDLQQDSLQDGLKGSGFDSAKPTVLAWLGVSYYLTMESFERALAGIFAVCAPGSVLIFDYMDPEVIDGTSGYRGARRAAQSVRRRNEPYTLGITEQQAVDAAKRAGFELVETNRVTDLVRNYGKDNPYCSPDDYMGLVTVRRPGEPTA